MEVSHVKISYICCENDTFTLHTACNVTSDVSCVVIGKPNHVVHLSHVLRRAVSVHGWGGEGPTELGSINELHTESFNLSNFLLLHLRRCRYLSYLDVVKQHQNILGLLLHNSVRSVELQKVLDVRGLRK
jgi:hypothetical protein